MSYLPPIDERLVAALAAQFPDVSPDVSLTDREIMFRAGQVSVVRFLAGKLEEQESGYLPPFPLCKGPYPVELS